MSEYFRIYRPQLLKYCAAPCVLALLLLFAAFLYTRPSAPYRVRGVEKLAVVKDVSPRPNLKAELTYYFIDGARAHEYKRVVPSQWKLMADSSKQIPVTQLPENPDLHMIGTIADIQRDEAPAEYMRITAVLLLLGGVSFLGCLYLRIKKMLNLIANGSAVVAAVSARNNDPMRKVKAEQISYHFNGPDGRWYEGRSPSLPPDVLAKFPSGTKVPICFFPNNPAAHCPDLLGLRKRRPKVQHTQSD